MNETLRDNNNSTVRKRTRQGRVTQDQVLDAALALVLENGVSAVSLRKIAAKVNCAAPTIYYYFRSKQEILETLWSRQIDQVLEHSLSHITLDEALFHYGHYWMVHRSLFQLMFMGGGVKVEELPGYQRLCGRLQERFEANGMDVESAQRRTRIALSAIHGLVLSSVHQYLESPEAETILQSTIDLLLGKPAESPYSHS